MRSAKKHEFQNIYNLNPETNAYIIQVSLDDYSELFNGWDASPLRRKDLEPELLDYLEQAGTEIPLKENIEICFHLPSNVHDVDKESKSLTGIQNNFKVVMFFINKTLKTNYRQLAIYMIMGTLFLVGAYVTKNLVELQLLFSIMIEGFFIGGWFLLWEAFSLFFFESHETRHRRNIIRRFLECNIYFKDTEPK